MRRQSEHLADYRAAADVLRATGLLYPCFCARAGIARGVAALEEASEEARPARPDGGPLYPGFCRGLGRRTRQR